MSRNALLIGALSLLALHSGCSTAEAPLPNQNELSPVKLELFAARGAFGRRDYELFRLEQDTVWAECGPFVKPSQAEKEKKGLQRALNAIGSNNAPVSKNELQLTAEQTHLDVIESDRQRAIRTWIDSVFAEIPDPPKRTTALPAPASGVNFAKPGIFELNITLGDRTEQLSTSLDAVSSGESELLRSLRALFAELRSSGPVLCGDVSFYGIGRNPAGPFEPRDLGIP